MHQNANGHFEGPFDFFDQSFYKLKRADAAAANFGPILYGDFGHFEFE